jgi:hypothetical protein
MDLRAQVDALIAQHAALGQSLALLRSALPEPQPRVSVSVPDRCASFREDQCGLQSDDAWSDVSSFGAPHARRCRGCRVTVGTEPM